jgi:hypothetical protein
MEWFAVIAGQQRGPLSDRQLADLAESGFMRPHDMVRPTTSVQWVRAGSVPGLFDEDVLERAALEYAQAAAAAAPHVPQAASIPSAGHMTTQPLAMFSHAAAPQTTFAAAAAPAARASTPVRRRTSSGFLGTAAAILVGGAASVYVFINFGTLIEQLTGKKFAGTKAAEAEAAKQAEAEKEAAAKAQADATAEKALPPATP